MAECSSLTEECGGESEDAFIGRIRLGGFVEHFKIVEHISYSTGTSRDFVKHKRCQQKFW